MRPLSPLALAALAIFAEGPRHAYDVYSVMRMRREDLVVKLSAGSLYHAINRMESDGLLAPVGTDREGNRPERTTLEITDAGREQLHTQVRDMVATPVKEYPRFPVAMAEAHNLPREEIVGLLQTRIALLEDEYAALRAGADRLAEKKLPRRWWLDTDYVVVVLKTELDWCRNLLTDLRDGTLDWNADYTPTHAPDDRLMFATRLHPTPPRTGETS